MPPSEVQPKTEGTSPCFIPPREAIKGFLPVATSPMSSSALRFRPISIKSARSDTSSLISGFGTDDDWSVDGSRGLVKEEATSTSGQGEVRGKEERDKMPNGDPRAALIVPSTVDIDNDIVAENHSIDTQTTFSEIHHSPSSIASLDDVPGHGQERYSNSVTGGGHPPVKRRHLKEEDLVQESKKIKFGSFTTDMRHQALLLQKQLSVFTRTLEESHSPVASPYNQEVAASSSSEPDSSSDSLAQLKHANIEEENAKLQQVNADLRKELCAAWETNESLKSDLDLHGQKGELDRITMGIDPQVIQILASDLAVGTQTPANIAEALFNLVENATPLVTDPAEFRRHHLTPRERLRNLEGVVDVSLGRVEKLEAEIKGIQYPNWFGNTGKGSAHSHFASTQRSTFSYDRGAASDDDDTEDGRSHAEQTADQAWATAVSSAMVVSAER